MESTEEPELKKAVEQPKTLSPLQETELPRASKIPTATPKRRRMASVLDAVMEFVKAQTPASAPDTGGKALKKLAKIVWRKLLLSLDLQLPPKHALRGYSCVRGKRKCT
jgi:hypothetical protein